MGLQLYVSNSLEQLCSKLNEGFKNQKTPVFHPHFIVTQTDGMNNWIKLQMAGEEGIAANMQFLKPNDFIHKAYQLLGGPFSNSLSADNLTWLLFNILGGEDFIRKFPAIAAYYTNDEKSKALKRIALSEKLADLFDQYQVYRPDMIEQWNQDDLGQASTEEWQKYIWLQVRETTGNKLTDKTKQGTYISEALQDAEKREGFQSRMPDVHVFGISIAAPYHLQLLRALGQYINISFYLLNPAPLQYWQDTISEKQAEIFVRKGIVQPDEMAVGNALLTSCGKIVKDTFSLLFEEDELLNAYTEVGIKDPGTDSLLHTIQHDIFYNKNNSQRKILSANALQDGSVTIHSCYTIAREVESLYNYLVHLVDKRKKTLSPRDIVVMVSDIDAYAPYIKAVFENAPYRFTYTIADESFTKGDTIISALKAVMEVREETFNAEDIVQLLDSASIRGRFGLTNISLIRKIVNKANIRFGTVGSKEDDTVYVSWKYGIQRIMYGICMSGEEEYNVGDDSFFPLDMLEGSESGELIRFCHFVQVLIDAIDKRKESRSIADWIDYVKEAVICLIYEVSDTVDNDYNVIAKRLQHYQSLNDFCREPVSYDVFCHNFLRCLSATTRSAAFGGGGITFCSLIPMRSIPFKVVALLGLNFDKFPRKQTAFSFNLLDEEKRRGDRNVKDNDKHLFLETILSAKESLYISYLGQSVKDNATLPPSALIDELIDYIEARCPKAEDVRKQLIVRQPLHSFSRRYATGDEGLYSYLIEKDRDNTDFIDHEKEPEGIKHEEISLNSLIAFFKNPFKTYYNNVLHIKYDDETVLLGATELFELDRLQQWLLKQELLTLQKEEWELFKKKLVKTGRLPLKNMSHISLQEIEKTVYPVRQNFLSVIGSSPCSTVSVDIQAEGVLLKGNIGGVYDGNLVFVCFSKNECNYQIEAYIRYIAGCVAGCVNSVCFISAEKDAVYKAVSIGKIEAQQHLGALIKLYKQGHQKILPFYPDFTVKPSTVADLDEDSFKIIVDKTLDNYASPCTDPYIMWEYNNGYFKKKNVVEEYKAAAQVLLVPLTQLFPDCYQ